MNDDLPVSIPTNTEVEHIRVELAKTNSTKGRRIVAKFVLAALGAIPWVGGFIAAAASVRGDESASRADELRTRWLEEHETKFAMLGQTLEEMSDRIEALGAETEDRVQSPEYLALVRQAFRTWDHAETDDKRKYVANLLINCAGTRVCSDDVIRLFISWLDLYHEAHFAVIREIHQNPGSTRFDIWSGVYGEGGLPREDSAEADLYKMLMRDLSTGGVLRQVRETDHAGRFVRKRPAKRRGPVDRTMKSAFDDEEKYVLTEMGKQFVHYTMSEVVGRLNA